MRITLDIDVKILEEVVKATGARTKKKAIEIAIKEFLWAKRREELSDLVGYYEGFALTLKDLKKCVRVFKMMLIDISAWIVNFKRIGTPELKKFIKSSLDIPM